MTNYNERLDEIVWKTLRRHRKMINGPVPSDILYSEKEPTDIIFDEAKQVLTSLIKELVAEAKPDNLYKTSYGLVPEGLEDEAQAYDLAVQKFEQNLLKALEEV